jgi:hypothetical protein
LKKKRASINVDTGAFLFRAVHFIRPATYGADIALLIATVDLVNPAAAESKCRSVITVADDKSSPSFSLMHR